MSQETSAGESSESLDGADGGTCCSCHHFACLSSGEAACPPNNWEMSAPGPREGATGCARLQGERGDDGLKCQPQARDSGTAAQAQAKLGCWPFLHVTFACHVCSRIPSAQSGPQHREGAWQMFVHICG